MPDDNQSEKTRTIAELQSQLAAARTQISELEERVERERVIRLELEQAEPSLEEYAARWLFAIEGTGAGVVDWDVVNNRFEYSERWLMLTGYSREEMDASADGLVSLVHPDDLPVAMADIEEVLAGRKSIHANEHRLLHKQGHWIWVQSRSMVSARDELGNPLRMIGTHIDITESWRTEEALRESEARFRVLADGAPVVLFVDGPQGGVQFVNRTYCEYFGITPKEVEGGKWQPLIHPDDAESYIGRFMAAVREQVPFKGEVRVRRADGQWRSSEVTAEPRISPAGEYLGHAGIVIDITDRIRAEEERVRLHGELLHAQKLDSVGRLAGGVAHDFNNMLSVILGGVELALRQVEREPLRERLLQIRTAAERSADLTRQLLAFARKQAIAPRPIDLNHTLSEMTSIIGRLIGENIELHWQPSPALWPVKMDSGQLDQIVTNLCVNARDSIANIGWIRIDTNNCSFDRQHCDDHPGDLQGDFVRLVVTDNGCGMNEEDLAHLFEPFFTTKSVGGGTGLGLATVYGIVQQNKGFIRVASVPNEGSSFEVFLPRSLEEFEVVAVPANTRSRRDGTETILLVEDESALSRTYTRMLEELGYRVIAATSPSEAIRLAEESIDLLITDVIMPEMNGRQLASTLSIRWPKLKHLFMSGYTADIIGTHGVLDTGVMFLEKPFTSQELGAKVEAILSQGHTNAEREQAK